MRRKRCFRKPDDATESGPDMKQLGLFRHAKSDWNDARLRDFDRPLNERGRKGAALMGVHIRDHGVRWSRIIASPAARVTQTIEIASDASGESPPILWDRRIYLASSATLMDLLAELRAANLAELSRVMERVRLIRGISSSETSIHLETYRLS